MSEWSKTLRDSYREAARKLVEAGYEHRNVKGETIKEIFVKDGHAFYLGRELGSSRYTTYPCNF